MNIQHIVGSLTVTNKENFTVRSEHDIFLAASKHRLYAVSEPALWDHGLITLRRQNFVTNGKEAAEETIASLAAFIKEEGIPQLGLKGEATIVTTGDETVAHHLKVENNELTYTEAIITWDNAKVAK